MAAHQRGVAVLAELATSFGVSVSESDEKRWFTLLSVNRAIEDAWLKSQFFHAGPCQTALVSGKPYGGNDGITEDIAKNYSLMYTSTSDAEKIQLDELPHELIRHLAIIQDHQLTLRDVQNRNFDHRKKLRDFQSALEEDARYRAELFALSLTESPNETTENAKRILFNTWLKDFYVAYEHIGAFGHAKRDVENGRHKVEVGSLSQAWVATRSLVRCVTHGRPGTAKVLLSHGSRRVARKLVGRL